MDRERLIDQPTIHEALVRLVRQTHQLIFDNVSLTRIKFVPSAWDNIRAPRKSEGGLGSGRMLIFEFRNNPKRLRLVLWLGPGPAETRELLFQRAQRGPSPRRRQTLSPKWSAVWSRSFLQPVDYEAKVAADALTIINERWRQFIDHELPEIVQAIAEEGR